MFGLRVPEQRGDQRRVRGPRVWGPDDGGSWVEAPQPTAGRGKAWPEGRVRVWAEARVWRRTARVVWPVRGGRPGALPPVEVPRRTRPV
jgi:hypothetical protein